MTNNSYLLSMNNYENKPEYSTNPAPFRAIRDWRQDDRPRERCIKHGASSLSDAELLAILISSGTKGFSALDASKALLGQHQSLSGLSVCDISQFTQMKGLGPAKAVTLIAAFEIGKRISSAAMPKLKTIKGPEDVARHYIPRLAGLKKEIFITLLLDSSNKIFRDVIISEGSLNASIVHPREVFKIAISESAASIILLHNHPSGNPEPSKEDIEITLQLVDAGKLLDINVFDHIIIAGKEYTSLANKGII